MAGKQGNFAAGRLGSDKPVRRLYILAGDVAKPDRHLPKDHHLFAVRSGGRYRRRRRLWGLFRTRQKPADPTGITTPLPTSGAARRLS